MEVLSVAGGTAVVLVGTFLVTWFFVPIFVGMLLGPFVVLLRAAVGRRAAYFLGRYSLFILGNYCAGALSYLAMAKVPTVSWLVWAVFAYCVLAGFRTLYDFDVMCLHTNSGIFATAYSGEHLGRD